MSFHTPRGIATFGLVLCTAAVAVLVVHTPAAQTGDIVLYASDVTVIRGNWARTASSSGAGGQRMTSQDRGWSSASVPLSTPADYFEAEFDATAGVAYRLWLRMRAAGDSKFNDAVWVQFSGAMDANGASLWPIGTDSALLVNLENCADCGLSGWGWQDNSWWLAQSSVVRFRTTGRQTIRVQTREDGVDVDQIVLSAGTYLSTAPGGVRNDATIVPKATTGATILRGPYLQQVTDNSAVVVWTTRQPGVPEVRYSRSGGPVVSTIAETRLFPAGYTGLSHDFYQHEARLAWLGPATRYTYDVFMGGTDATPGQDAFTTAPLTGTGSVRFIAFGDSGVGSTAQRQLAGLMGADPFDLAIHTGDVAYGSSSTWGGGNYAQYDDWVFGVYAAWFRSRPFFPSLGNHDDEINFGQAYRDVFVLPENGASAQYPDHSERYYSFDYGPVHFVALDSERAFRDPARRPAQLAWLDADLSATRQPWRVAFFHRAPYSAGPHHGSDIPLRQAFAPIFERHGVQLVVAAHEHNYQRSIPLREYGGAPVTYIVTGGGGAPLYPAGVAPFTAATASVHHYVRATAGECTLRLEAVRVDGAVFDTHSLERCAPAPSPPPAQSGPYGGVPAALPGTIQAENFDTGTSGVAYYDTTASNSGGQYRATDVDIEGTSDAGGGFNIGWMAPGEWLKYTVNVTAAGTYTLEARVASSGSGGTFHIEVNGVDRTGPLTIPNTGAWQSWTTISKPGISLGGGTQVWRVVIDSAGPGGVVGNLNWIRVTAAPGGSTPFSGTPAALPGTIQAENFDNGISGVAYFDTSAGNSGGQYRATDVDIEATADSGGGYNVGWVGAGEWLAYTVNVSAAGTYDIDVRVASPGAGGTFHIEVNGVDRTGPLVVPNTGGWQTWTTIRKSGVSLAAGQQVWRVVMDTNGVTGAVGNFNWIHAQ